MRRWAPYGGSLLLLATIAGCASSQGSEPQVTSPASEVGTIEIPATTYELHHTQLTSGAAKLFYSFHPATSSPESKPLFVLTGGGPGASILFLLMFTSPNGVNHSETAIGPNADALTDVANLLYVDSRNAGLSRNELPDPTNEGARRAEFAVQNYNVFQDAADVLRAVLAFLDAHPALGQHDVYFVAESYGGARTTAMLSFLLDHAAYAEGRQLFHSQDLDDRIERYMKQELGGQPSPDDVAQRFRGQILLEPILAGARQNEAAGALFEKPGSVIDKLAQAAGATYQRCSAQVAGCDPFDNAQALLHRINRSRYDYRADSTWLAKYLALAAQVGTDPAALGAITNAAPSELDAVLARKDALDYRFGNPVYGAAAVRGTSETAWGALPSWDAYFVPLSSEALLAFYSQPVVDAGADPKADVFGELFLRNLRYVPTMVTRADYDLEIYGPAVPLALRSFPEVGQVTELLSESEEISVQYRDGTERRFFSPIYHQSSHSVARDESAKLRSDIEAFLRRR
jgi:hypothetical protein